MPSKDITDQIKNSLKGEAEEFVVGPNGELKPKNSSQGKSGINLPEI